MIKVMTGFSGPGGSTVAFNNLVNLFNKNGLDACLYGPQAWDGITCRFSRTMSPPTPNKEDTVIYHFMKQPEAPCKKLILSCHETELFPIKRIPDLKYDEVHFVSEFQKKYQGVPGTVIPNVINKYKQPKVFPTHKVAGIIGSIDKNKQVHVSIDRALREDIHRVEIWGSISDFNYFNQEVLPKLGPRVSYHGVSNNMQEVYDRLSVVYASSKLECLPTIHGECLQLGIPYKGLSQSKRAVTDYEFDDDAIMAKWNEIL
tara:strand:- start:307 stop:1083 length:777 start_codon:yes stop_codon:yes gene_type:complete